MSDRQKTALVCGAGGFIGSHLVKRLAKDGYWVRGVDQKRRSSPPPRRTSSTSSTCATRRLRGGGPHALGEPFDEVYQLAADMGGMGFIHSAECEIMRNSALININMIMRRPRPACRATSFRRRSASTATWPLGEPEMTGGARPIPRSPTTSTAGRSSTPSAWPWPTAGATAWQVRIARFQNCYGPEGTWTRRAREGAGGASAARWPRSRTAARSRCGATARAVRSYTYVDDMVDGIYR